MRLIIFALLVTCFQFTSYSQTSTEDYLGSWYTYGSSHRLNERFSLNPYAELRFYEASSNYNLAFVSVRGNYHFKKNEIKVDSLAKYQVLYPHVPSFFA